MIERIAGPPDVSAQRRYYDCLWTTVPAVQLNAHERSRRDVIEHALAWLSGREPPPWSIVEVGCGRGWLSGLVLSSYGEAHALDLSPDSIRKARDAFPAVRWEARDIFDAPLAATHDLVVSSEVIEHVADQRAFVERLVAATRPRGWLLVTTPNARVAREYQRRPDFRPQPIENLLDPRDLADLLRPACRVVRLETFFFGQVDRPSQRLARSSRVRALTARSRGRDPLSRIFSRARLGLYTMVLAQRLT
jgi:2-polyprenyl-3-methyl-5-hydroxy-6-metoxy-1,4-benzoquinol methylase